MYAAALVLEWLSLLVLTTTTTSIGDNDPIGPIAAVLPSALPQATLANSASVPLQLQKHGWVRIEPTVELVRAVEAAEEATALLFALADQVKNNLDASHVRPNSSALRRMRPELADLTESCIGVTGLRLRPSECTTGSFQHSQRKHNHQQFHAVVDPATMDALRWPVTELPSLRAAVQGAVEELSNLSQSLLRVTAPELLGAWEQEVASRGDPSVIDLFRYDGCKGSWWSVGPDGSRQMEPECWVRDESKGDLKCCEDVGMSGHVDPGIFSCKYVGAAQIAGLEVLDRESGAWIGETLFRGSAVCFVNEALAEWALAKGLPSLTATSHRVAPSGATPRLSVVYEMRVPKMRHVWTSAKQRSKAQRAEKKREAKEAERQRRQQRSADH
jgi:isopenicillin N synthase-like dioxygenase